jgi:adenylate cyclase
MDERAPAPARRRALQVAAAAAAVAAVVSGLLFAEPFRTAEARLYDLFATLAPPVPSPDVVVVAIDEPSFADVGAQWPWPRSIHARLITALREAGARAIGLDIIFSEPSEPAEDEALAAVLGPDVVLAADETLIETDQAVQAIRTEPLPMFTARGAIIGLAPVLIDGDGVVRRVPPFREGFSARLLDAARVPFPPPPEGALLAPAGPARTFRTVSYYQALDPAGMLPPGTFQDAIVLVGLSLQNAADVDMGSADTFATSFTTRTHQLVAGVEVQATVLDNLRRGLAVRPLPLWGEILAVIAAAAAAGLAARRGARPRTVLKGAFAVGGLVVASGLLLAFGRIWAPPVAPSLALFGVLAVQAVTDYAGERRMRREITRAFARYLSPDLVARLAADPAALKLGGERRTLTILFCDVRGFTTISEHLKDEPERLTALVNRLLDPLSDEVLKRGGTIDKYMGDCVMAFWNAPLDEPDHAGKAVEAALAMVDAAAALGRALAGETDSAGRPIAGLSVGVGVNTGDVVVGNMGSTARFDYTAVGDPVNYASRLQDLTRAYAVDILVGEETRDALGDRFVFATVDTVVVRGRSAAAPVFTVLRDPVDPALLAEHEAVVAEAAAGRSVESARLEALSAALPALAGVHRRIADATRRS